MTTIEDLRVAAGRQSSPMLFACLAQMEAVPLGKPERLVMAAISDVLAERHGLDAVMDRIYAGEDYAGTYTEALVHGLCRSPGPRAVITAPGRPAAARLEVGRPYRPAGDQRGRGVGRRRSRARRSVGDEEATGGRGGGCGS